MDESTTSLSLIFVARLASDLANEGVWVVVSLPNATCSTFTRTERNLPSFTPSCPSFTPNVPRSEVRFLVKLFVKTCSSLIVDLSAKVESADLLVCVGDQTTLRLASTLLHPPSADLYTSSLSHLGSEAPRPLPIPVLLLHPDSHKEDLSQLMTNSHSKDSSQLLMTDNENETDKDLVMAALRGDLPLRKEMLEVVLYCLYYIAGTSQSSCLD